LLTVAGIYLAGMALDSAVLAPKIVGRKIGLHPVWLIFALFVFSYLFGFVGLLVAVPVAAAVGVLVRFALEVYLGSSVYTGVAPIRDRVRSGGPHT
jgi:predicted PurR-regulated permease PerM